MAKSKKPTLMVRIHAIGGDYGGDQYIGVATDARTGLTLLDAVASRRGYAVSLHGNGLEREATSREFSLPDALALFMGARDKGL